MIQQPKKLSMNEVKKKSQTRPEATAENKRGGAAGGAREWINYFASDIISRASSVTYPR